MTTHEILTAAVKAKPAVAALSNERKNEALAKMAECLAADSEKICLTNREDVEAVKGTVSPVMIDRLTLTPERVRAMADSILQVADLPDPVGRVIESISRPNGLKITKVSVPFGVLAM
ncbi:MAG: gamma-glutamyl-phosphate reductase, partial [Clostridia bacterium]|nr:gamma-glutamyl-phosphate reductase [Clostridia bacterium]